MAETPKTVTGKIVTSEIRVDRLDFVGDLALPGHEISLVEQTPAAVVVDLTGFDHVVYAESGAMWCWNDLPDQPDREPRGLPAGWIDAGYIGDGQDWHRVPPKTE